MGQGEGGERKGVFKYAIHIICIHFVKLLSYDRQQQIMKCKAH